MKQYFPFTEKAQNILVYSSFINDKIPKINRKKYDNNALIKMLLKCAKFKSSKLGKKWYIIFNSQFYPDFGKIRVLLVLVILSLGSFGKS